MNIRIDHVSKTFGSVLALDRLDLDIRDGELFFLLGASGSGKTTLLRILGGFCTPDQGEVFFDDRPVTRLPAHRRATAMVFQGYALWPHLTVFQNVAFGLEMRRIPAAERQSRVMQALELVNIADLAQRRPGEISGGQQQRVALARALVVQPGCLLLDEPLANLDAKLRLRMRTEIRRLCEKAGLTAVYVTHDQQEALSMADRLAVLHQGRLVQVGTPEEIYARPASLYVASFIGEINETEARVEAVRADNIVLDSPWGTLYAPPDRQASPGDTVRVAVRPEAFTRSPESDSPATPNQIRGQIAESMYLGETVKIRIELAGGRDIWITELRPRGRPAPGTRETFRVAPEDILLFPADSNE